MRYGYFDDKNFEYVIDKPDTPRPWTNYLGSTKYGAIITNHAGGFSFYKSAKNGRFLRFRANTIPMDQPGRYFYIKDQKSKDFWSTSWQPVGKDLTHYKSICRHGTAYTIIESEYDHIFSESTYFVPLHKDYECWILKVVNKGTKVRNLTVFTYAEFASHWNLEADMLKLQYSQYIVNAKIIDTILDIGIHTDLPYDDEKPGENNSWHAFFTIIGAKITGYDTDREEVIGVYNGYHNPKVLLNGNCHNTTIQGDNACGTMQVDITLQPGESKEMAVIMGVGRAQKAGKDAVNTMKDVSNIRCELEKVKNYWHNMIGNFVTETPDPYFNSTVNVWGAYNCLITYTWSRAASFVYHGERDGLGYRDTVQDIIGVLNAIPEKAGKRLELMITGQCSTGGALPVVDPFNHYPGKMAAPGQYRSDDCLWLFNTIPGYVKETGDLDFYNKILPYSDKGEDTVLNHLKKALAFNLNLVGQNNLPCVMIADWNDCIGLGYKAESLFTAMQVRYGLKEYIDICIRLNKPDEEKWARKELTHLDKAIQTAGWEGNWFIRSIDENGEKYGTQNAKEAKIFLNPQCWAVLSKAGTREQVITAMNSVYKILNTGYGIMLLAPPFKAGNVNAIGASIYNDGQKENAGIFCHPQGWAVMAEAILGRGNRAYEYFYNFMPARMNDEAEIRQIEPYVYCQSTFSKFSKRFGTSRLPWLSGSASWAYYSATHYILGIRPEYDGLTIDPCVPEKWKGFRIKRIFRGKEFVISVDNSAGVEKGVKEIVMNNTKIEGTKIHIKEMKEKNEVSVIMG